MAHIHGVYDTDTHFIIDGVTRKVKNASETKKMVAQHDHNSERFSFELPRKIDGHDMTTCNVVQVHYLNVDAKTKERNPGIYEVDDIRPSTENEDVAICSWLISGNATKYVGSLAFVIRFVCSEDGTTIDYAWHTAVNESITVVNGIHNSEIVAEEHADIIQQWRQLIVEEATAGAAEAQKKAEEAKEAAETAKSDAEQAAINAEQAEYDSVIAKKVAEEAARKAEESMQDIEAAEKNVEQFAINVEKNAGDAKESAENAARSEQNANTYEVNASQSAKQAEIARQGIEQFVSKAEKGATDAAASAAAAEQAQNNVDKYRDYIQGLAVKVYEEYSAVSGYNVRVQDMTSTTRRYTERAETAANRAEAAANSVDLPKPTADNAGKAVIVNESGDGFTLGEAAGGSLGDTEQIALLAELDMLPAIQTADGRILTDDNGTIMLRY